MAYVRIADRAGITVIDSVDSGDWERALDAMVLRLDVATGDASLAAAEKIRDAVKVDLTELSHGEYSFSPAPPGHAPARVSGALAASIAAELVSSDTAMVGPQNLRYARIQELGGDMHGHPYMVFFKDYKGFRHKFRRTFVHLEPRPYLAPVTREAVDTGVIRDTYIDIWSAAIEG